MTGMGSARPGGKGVVIDFWSIEFYKCWVVMASMHTLHSQGSESHRSVTERGV
jgi:hypothetical protein